ncbi:hypothetical protein SAMN02910358_02569 [Lachnospiraceae bacterium XBB1006]|nr:hypothetical protein SAMN02910358_02569 [Lachnospiraceae bacterium XBB1006]
MNKKLIALLLSATITTTAFTGCGSDKQESKKTETKVDITQETGSHDASEKENSYASDLAKANAADKGSADTLSGSYTVDKLANTRYVFAENTMALIETGTYKMEKGAITLSYGTNAETKYTITETDAGFNLIHDSNLLSLVYMEGTDGLTGTDAFDGVYGIENSPGFLFCADGTLTVITTHECEIKKDTVCFGGATYNWEAKDGKIELSSNGTKVMTLVP